MKKKNIYKKEAFLCKMFVLLQNYTAFPKKLYVL